MLSGVQALYGMYGKGVEFFPSVEPDVAMIHVHARGDLSVVEKKELTLPVERAVLDIDGFKPVYTFIGTRPDGSSGGGEDVAEGVIARIQVEFEDWPARPTAGAIPTQRVQRPVRKRT